MLSSVVVTGDGVGKKFGYPTANLQIRRSQVTVSPGVYAARATLERVVYRAALIIRAEPWKIEVHLLNYNGPDFYGAFLTVDPIQKISELESYESTGELKEKIAADLKLIDEFLAEQEKKA